MLFAPFYATKEFPPSPGACKETAMEHELLELTAQIVAAFASSNRVAAGDLPALLAHIHRSLASASEPPAEAADKISRPSPAAIRRSVQPDFITSFEDGRPYKALKRHLTARGLTPKTYREKWGLSDDYPMVASSYSALRAERARAIGLGARRKKPAAAAPPRERPPAVSPEVGASPAAPQVRRGRKRAPKAPPEG
jgi:predicted transcriptional regulator